MKLLPGFMLCCSLSLCPLFSAPDPPVIKKDLDFLAGDQLPQNWSHAWTLRQAGARGWAQTGGNSSTGNTKRSCQIYVTQVTNNSPASDKLQKGNVIFGLNWKPFQSDARIALAKEIAKVESGDGKLRSLKGM